MRFLSIALVSIFIFYLGVQAGSMNEAGPSRQSIVQTETDESLNKQSSITFIEKHQAVLAQTDEQHESKLFGVAVFLENIIKNVFSFLFQFFYRFCSMFF
ncbi:hypothetical protein ACLIA0_01205 [Bacillaceae bacterium W0354]